MTRLRRLLAIATYSKTRIYTPLTCFSGIWRGAFFARDRPKFMLSAS